MQPTLSLAWALPFAGLIALIAVMPMLAARLWHHRMGMFSVGCALALLGPMAAVRGLAATEHLLVHAMLLEYLPFVALLLALFTAGGGILIEGGPWGRPGGNTALLALGTLLAGVMGTTGVSMVLIHPLLRANAHRRRKVHLVVFFIVLVANAGGATSPLGDPPLYLGFLLGVPFGWPLVHLTRPLLVLAAPMLAAFYLVDRWLEGDSAPQRPMPLRLRGWGNVGLVGLVVATVLAQGVWHPGVVAILEVPVGLERLLGMAVLLGIAAVSLWITPRAVREGNLFNWAPMREVLVLFAGIFITIGPALAILAEGPSGAAGALVGLSMDAAGAPRALAYFWLTGLLSAFLDNAPTYLVFFQMAGNDASVLTGARADVLRAISSGAVFFGALTYIGNAPNMMVRSIAAHRGIRMPGFFGYMLWAAALLLPALIAQSLLFFR